MIVSRKSPAVLVAAALVVSLAVPTTAQEPTVEVLAEGLTNPRGVKVADDGSVYVAEAGAGGDECMMVSFAGAEQEACFGPTGAVIRVSADGVERVVEGLASQAAGEEAGGASDVALAADGSIYVIQNLGADPATREGAPEGLATSGWLLRATPDGSVETVADVAAFESANDPDAEFGGEVDSNPYGLLATDAGILVADAGGNDVLLVGEDGSVSLVAVFPPEIHEFSAEALAAMGPPPEGEGEAPPEGDGEGEAPPADAMVPIPVQAVPTSLALGPDGAVYVGQLTGGPFPVGGASVFRLAEGEEPTEYATGFTNIMGLGFGPDGTLYVAEMVHEGLMTMFSGAGAPIGAVVAVGPDGGEPTVIATGEQFMALGGLAVDAEGAIYVSTGTVMGPGAGTLLKIVP